MNKTKTKNKILLGTGILNWDRGEAGKRQVWFC